MVKNVSVTAGTDFVDIVWSLPKLLPMSYKVNVVCRLLYNGLEYKRLKIEATPLDTMVNVPSLLPGSHCVFTFHAIYNPASVDNGITHTVFTMNSSKWLRIYTFLIARCANLAHIILRRGVNVIQKGASVRGHIRKKETWRKSASLPWIHSFPHFYPTQCQIRHSN